MFSMKNVASVGLGTVLLVLTACNRSSKNTEEIAQPVENVAQLRVINVLDANLHNDAHIKGSVNVPFDKLVDAAQQWSKNDTLVLYCSNYLCSASKIGAQQLQALGFTNVYAYEGGMAEWFTLNKADATFAFEGPATEGYLTLEVQKPTQEASSDVRVITANDLKQKMQDAGLLA